MPTTTLWLPKREGDREHDPIRGIDYVWRPEVARRQVAWFEKHLQHVKGPDAAKPIRFQPWQTDFLSALYGWRVVGREDDARYRRALLEVARGNGKSTMCAAVGLRGVTRKKAPLVIGAATDREAAGIVFGDAARMVRANSQLSDHLKVIDSTKRILRKDNLAGRYLVISSEAPRAHGYHPDLVIFDELHTQPKRDLWDVLTTSQINLTDALMFAITTAGFDRTSICWDVHQNALRACEDRSIAPDMLAAIYAADDGDDIENPDVWAKANPNLGVSVVADNLKAEIAKAKRDPAYMNTVMRLHLNLWTEQDIRWMPMREWDACGGLLNEDELAGRPCFAGLDLAQVSDLTALALLFPPENRDDGVYKVLMRFYLPEAALANRADYQIWRDRGLITVTPGKATNYAFVRDDIIKLAAKYRIEKLAYDRFLAGQLAGELESEGIRIEPFGQGYKSMSDPTKGLMRMILDRRINHGGNAVLRWNASNLVVTQDPAANIKPDKSKANQKIDGIVSVIMALGVEMGEQQDAPQVLMIG